MNEEHIKPRSELLKRLNEHHDARRKSYGDHMPAEFEIMDDVLQITNLFADGQNDVARSRLLAMVEKYPHDIVGLGYASHAFKSIGMQEEACKCLIMILAIKPEYAQYTCRTIADYMYRNGAPNRTRAILDIYWEHARKNTRRKDVEAAKEKYYARYADKL